MSIIGEAMLLECFASKLKKNLAILLELWYILRLEKWGKNPTFLFVSGWFAYFSGILWLSRRPGPAAEYYSGAGPKALR